jgi:hypothetical protein
VEGGAKVRWWLRLEVCVWVDDRASTVRVLNVLNAYRDFLPDDLLRVLEIVSLGVRHVPAPW